MKTSGSKQSGITLLEVMILMAVLAVLAAMLLPTLARPRSGSCRISCVNNLKQVGLSARQWAMDHGDRYPAAVTADQGGAMADPAFEHAWRYLVVLSNEVNIPQVLRCPADEDKSETYAFDGTVTDANISYFVGLAADETKPTVIFSGDRNLTADGSPLKPGLYTLSTNDVLGWSKAMHNQAGNIGLSDGSVQQFSIAGLQQYLWDNPQANRFAIP